MAKDDMIITDLTGKMDPKEWEKGDKLLALKTASFLTKHGCTVAISTTDDGALLLDYNLDGLLQPTVRIYAGKLIWPRGTNYNLMMSFLQGE